MSAVSGPRPGTPEYAAQVENWRRSTAAGAANASPGQAHADRRQSAGRGTFWEEAERLKTLMGSIPGGSESAGTTGGGLTPGMPVYGDLEGANNEEFGRAKDRVGQLTRGSLRGLREALAGQGRLGGGLEAMGTAEVLGSGAGQLADTVREQAIQNVDRRRHTMDQNFSAQREAASRAAESQRQRITAQQQSYLDALRALMQSHGGMY